MEAIKVEATLVEKTSQKSGNTYKCIELKLTPSYTKVVFLDNAELELLALNNKNNSQTSSPFDF